VYYGWDIKNIYLRDHWQEIDATSPFDGMGVIVAISPATVGLGNKSTSNQLGWRLFSKESWAFTSSTPK
jgi:hypothetical protein